MSVYLLDNERRRVLLQKSPNGPFESLYVPLSAEINDRETPVETLRGLISASTNLDFTFLGHNTSMPMVLDEKSVRIYPPFQVQVIVVDAQTAYVDSVYLAQAKAAPDFRRDGPISWFSQGGLKHSPNHVKHVAHYILALMSG